MTLRTVTKNNIHILNDDPSLQSIIFTHGFGTDQTAWSAVAEAFKDQYRLIMYDTVGAGSADPEAFSPNKYRSIHSYATDLQAICQELELRNAISISHSVGGMTTVLVANEKPEYFSKLVVIGASPRYLNDTDTGYYGGFTQEDLDNLYQAMSNNYFAWVSGFANLVMQNSDRPHLAEDFARSLGSIRPDIAQSVVRAIFQSDHRADLPKVQQDTLLIHSTEDVAVPDQVATYLHEHIRNSKLVHVNATGHFPHISAPGQVIDAIRQFL